MPNKQPPCDSTGPMGMQPVGHGRTTPTQTQPMMPGSRGEGKTPAPIKKQRTKAESVRAALARITRQNSLRKQRDAQKG
jgi:hypothetical protein